MHTTAAASRVQPWANLCSLRDVQMFGIAYERASGVQQLFTQLHTDYTFAYSSHPNCVLTAITKNLCKRQGAIDKEVRARATECRRLHARLGSRAAERAGTVTDCCDCTVTDC